MRNPGLLFLEPLCQVRECYPLRTGTSSIIDQKELVSASVCSIVLIKWPGVAEEGGMALEQADMPEFRQGN